MRRLYWIIGSSLLMLSAGTANAGWNEFCNRFCTDFRRMNCWPEPFISADRTVTKLPFMVIADAGWEVQRTYIERPSFQSGKTQQLTTAGQIKVKGIATKAQP